MRTRRAGPTSFIQFHLVMDAELTLLKAHEVSDAVELELQEAYPDLKANHSFLQLQTDISDVEADIQFARRYYNGAVRNLNTRIESFPDLFVARIFGYQPAQYFEFEETRPQ